MAFKTKLVTNNLKNTTKTVTSNRKLVAIIAILSALSFLAFIIYVTWILSGADATQKATNAMSSYLKNKYSESFVLKNLESQNSGLGQRGYWSATAVPDNDKSLTFEVEGNVYDNKFHDQYIPALWTRDAKSEFNTYVENTFGNAATQKSSFTIVTSRKLVDLATKDMTLQNALTEYPNMVAYVAKINVNGVGSDAISNASSNTVSFVSLFKQKNINLDLTVNLVTPSQKVFKCYLPINSINEGIDVLKVEECFNT